MFRHRCRSSRASGASESDVSDTESIYSGVSDISDLSDDGQTKQFEAKGSRFSPIRKRQFSVEEVDDDDDQDGEGAGRSHSQEDNVDEAEYRSSEDDNEESAFSVLLSKFFCWSYGRGLGLGPTSSSRSSLCLLSRCDSIGHAPKL